MLRAISYILLTLSQN